MQYLALGKGQGEKIESLILRASRIGDWVLLENMHLVANFLPKIEKMLDAMDTNNVCGFETLTIVKFGRIFK